MSFSFIPQPIEKNDVLSKQLLRSMQVLVMVATFGLFFVWLTPASLLLLPAKTLWLSAISALLLIFFAFTLLRQTELTFIAYAPLLAWWGVVAVSLAAALFSPNMSLALTGFAMEAQTVAFLGILGLLMTLMSIFANSQRASFVLITVLVGAIASIALLHIIRVIFGANEIMAGVLPGATATLVGSWNDLGILAALGIGILLIALVQLPLSRHLMGLLVAVIALLLFVMAMVNFSLLWFGLGFFSLALLLYTLTRDRFSAQPQAPLSVVVIGALMLVTIVAGLFIVSGTSIGQAVSTMTGTSHLEIRPSFGATMDITRQAISENVLFGVGPNHFADAWRNYRDPAIIATNFWNVDFVAGSGYIPTWFVTTGTLGIIAWLIFLLAFFYSGMRVLLTADTSDRLRFFVASVSFFVAAAVWSLAFLYVPGVVALTIGAIATGLLFATARSLTILPRCYYQARVTRRTSFALICLTLIMIVGSVGFLSIVARQTTALTTYAQLATLPNDQSQLDEAVRLISQAYQTYPRGTYLRDIISLQLSRLNQLLSQPEATEAEQQEFQSLLANTVQIASENAEREPNQPSNWLLLGDAFQILVAIDIEGASDRALEAYDRASQLDPLSPLYDLRRARLLVQTGDIEGARSAGREAVRQKANYVDALVFLAELEIATGNVEPAIQSVRSLLAIEPRNPRLYYQLGILLLADEELNTAVNAFTDALALDGQFANARYLRALIYAELGDRPRALSELSVIQDQNQDNETLSATVALVADESSVIRAIDLIAPVAENQPTVQQDVIVSDEIPDTDLLTPINQPNQGTSPAEEPTNDEPVSVSPEPSEVDSQ